MHDIVCKTVCACVLKQNCGHFTQPEFLLTKGISNAIIGKRMIIDQHLVNASCTNTFMPTQILSRQFIVGWQAYATLVTLVCLEALFLVDSGMAALFLVTLFCVRGWHGCREDKESRICQNQQPATCNLLTNNAKYKQKYRMRSQIIWSYKQ